MCAALPFILGVLMTHFAKVMSGFPTRMTFNELMMNYAVAWGALRGTVEGILANADAGGDVSESLRDLVDEMYRYRIWDACIEAVVDWGSADA